MWVSRSLFSLSIIQFFFWYSSRCHGKLKNCSIKWKWRCREKIGLFLTSETHWTCGARPGGIQKVTMTKKQWRWHNDSDTMTTTQWQRHNDNGTMIKPGGIQKSGLASSWIWSSWRWEVEHLGFTRSLSSVGWKEEFASSCTRLGKPMRRILEVK